MSSRTYATNPLASCETKHAHATRTMPIETCGDAFHGRHFLECDFAGLCAETGAGGGRPPACGLNSASVMRLAVLVLLLAACRPPGYGKGGDDTPTIDAPKPTADAAIDGPAATTCDNTFRLDGMSGATTVWLTGSFVNWGGNPGAGAVELVKGNDGAWTVTRTMDAGTHQYKFIVDGTNWIADPGNPSSVDDGFGGKNSLYVCTP